MWWLLLIPAVLAGLWLFMLWPARRPHPQAETFRGLLVAHRGLHNGAAGVPENSLPAYEAAIARGFGIEIDLHLTADGRLVSFHDDTLDRVCGVSGRPEAMTLSELRQLRLGDTDCVIPTLEEVLALVDGRVPLLIEYKSVGGNDDALCAAADAILRDYKGIYRIQSFYPLALRWYRKNRPDIARGQLSSCFRKEPDRNAAKVLLGFLIVNFLTRPDFISYDHHYPRAVGLRVCRALGAETAAWTITDPAALERCREQYDVCIFEGFIPEK